MTTTLTYVVAAAGYLYLSTQMAQIPENRIAAEAAQQSAWQHRWKADCRGDFGFDVRLH